MLGCESLENTLLQNLLYGSQCRGRAAPERRARTAPSDRLSFIMLSSYFVVR